MVGPLHTPAPAMPHKVPFLHARSYWQGMPGVRRHGRPSLTGATNSTMQVTRATTHVVLSETACTVPLEQGPNHSTEDMYLLHRRMRACRLNPPL
jgi:hypothetical protein